MEIEIVVAIYPLSSHGSTCRWNGKNNPTLSGVPNAKHKDKLKEATLPLTSCGLHRLDTQKPLAME